MHVTDDAMTFCLDYSAYRNMGELTKSDILAFLATDEPLSYADTMEGNLIALTVKWKYQLSEPIKLGAESPWPNMMVDRLRYGWPCDLYYECVELGAHEKLTREMLRGHLPSIGY